MVNLSDQFGWRFGLCSMEKKVRILDLMLCLSQPMLDTLQVAMVHLQLPCLLPSPDIGCMVCVCRCQLHVFATQATSSVCCMCLCRFSAHHCFPHSESMMLHSELDLHTECSPSSCYHFLPSHVCHVMQATDHAKQLMEKYLSKPFFDGMYADSKPRLTPPDWQQGLAWINDRFFPIRYEDEALPSVDWVLNVAKAAVLR